MEAKALKLNIWFESMVVLIFCNGNCLSGITPSFVLFFSEKLRIMFVFFYFFYFSYTCLCSFYYACLHLYISS